MLTDIINYLEFHPGLGTAGQPEPGQFAEIKAAGYEVIINLVPPASPDFLPDEAVIARGLGLEYIHIPVIWAAPRFWTWTGSLAPSKPIRIAKFSSIA